MKKVIALLVIGCLLLMMPGCNYNRGKSTSAPAVHKTVITPATANPPAETVQQLANHRWSPMGGTPWAEVDSTGATLGSVYCLIAVKGTLYAGTNKGVW
jgi:hypothetical protein